MTDRGEMSDIHIDALQEIGNIGLGNAATAFAGLLNKKVDMSVPKACFLELEQVLPLLGGLEEVVSCVNLGVEGDVPATVMFIFTEQSTYRIVDMLMGQEAGSTVAMDALAESAVMEVGNVLAGSFMNAIAGMTGLTMNSSVPMFAFDMMGAILSSSLIASGCWDDRVLVIETVFFQEQEQEQEQDQIKGHFFLLPETGAVGRLFEALGLPAGS